MRPLVFILAVMVAALGTVWVGALGLGAETEQPPWSRSINSQDEQQWYKARRLVLADRAEKTDVLLSIVNSPLEPREEFWTVSRRNTAIHLLGSMRVKEAVPSLMKWLVPRAGQGQTIDEPMIMCPAARALADIGLPAVPPLLEAVKEEGFSQRGKECLKALVKAIGPDDLEYRMRRLAQSGVTAKEQANLDACRKAIKENKIPVKTLWNP